MDLLKSSSFQQESQEEMLTEANEDEDGVELDEEVEELNEEVAEVEESVVERSEEVEAGDQEVVSKKKAPPLSDIFNCDEADERIRVMTAKMEQFEGRIDKDIENLKRTEAERKENLAMYSKIRDRIMAELGKGLLESKVEEHADFLRMLWSGEHTSSRHQAFHGSLKDRKNLTFKCVIAPFSDVQVDWVLGAIGKVREYLI